MSITSRIINSNGLLLIICVCGLLTGCLHNEYTFGSITITDAQKALIREFATENGYPPSMALDSFVRYVYDDWPNEEDRIDFILTFPKQDTTPRVLVLSDILTKIGKSLRVHYEPRPYGGAISSAIIDSIEIKTDSVIAMPALSLSYCNLTHLPPEIGKVRVRSLDISNNYPSLESLPDELMQLSEYPKYWDTLIVNYDRGAVKTMSTVSDSLKSWLIKYASKI